MGPFNDKTIQRFWSKVSVGESNQCWDWRGAKQSKGCGTMSANNKAVFAHRLSCFLKHGQPPSPLHHAMHSCDRPCCVNPAHLRWGTKSENMIDCSQKRRLPMGILLPSQVAYIKRLIGAGYSGATIAAWYGVCRNTILDLRRGRNWVHVEPATLIPFIPNQQEATVWTH